MSRPTRRSADRISAGRDKGVRPIGRGNPAGLSACLNTPPIVVVAKSAKLRFPRRHKLRIPRSGHAGQNSFTSLLRLSPPRGARWGPQCENCARSLAPPLPIARGAVGAPFGLAETETGRTRKGYAASVRRQSRQRLRDCTVQKEKTLWSQLCTCVQSCCTGVGVSVQAPISPGLRARYGLLRVCSCRPLPDGADSVGVQGRI